MYTLDTAAAIQRITDAGADLAVAQAIVGEMARSDNELATKADLEAHRAATKADLEAHRAATKVERAADLAALEVRLVKWGVGIAIGSVGVLFTLQRAFPG